MTVEHLKVYTSGESSIRKKKKSKMLIFNDGVKPKGEQLSIHEHLLNNPICAENYLYSRFKILSRARNTYHLSVLESLLNYFFV